MTSPFAEQGVAGTCPRCGQSQIVRGAAFTPLVAGDAPQLFGDAIRPPIPSGVERVPARAPTFAEHSFAKNPTSIRCVCCNLKFTDEEIDPTTERFAYLSAAYRKQSVAAP